MANAGRILILAKGAWEVATNYQQLDMVSRNSVAYLARQASVGIDPATDAQMNYWMPFGSAAQIATTSTAGLVMPDGTTITVTNTGLIKAVLGINDITDVTIASPSNNQVLRYNSTASRWENGSLGTAADKNSTNAVTSGSTDLVESGAVYDAIQVVSNKVSNSGDAYSPSKAYKVGEYVIHDDVLYRCITACSAAAWSVNQSCFTSDTLLNAVNLLNTGLTAITWRTSSAGFTYCVLPNGMKYAYKLQSITSGTEKTSTLYPNSYWAEVALNISDIGFTKPVLVHADFKGSFPQHLAVSAGVTYNQATCIIYGFFDNPNATWGCQVELIGF